jgi:hypothetical protein
MPNVVKCTKRLVSQPDDWWDAFEARANQEGKTLSAWLGDAGRKLLPKSESKSLSVRPKAIRPKKVIDK